MIRIPMTPAQFDLKAAELKAQQGIELTGNAGTISKSGLVGTWSYDGTTLTVTITKAPVFFRVSYCESQLQSWLTGS